jgi:signal recognition particle subunit SRP72
MGDYEACGRIFGKLQEEDADDVGLLANAVASRVSENKPREALLMMADQEENLESSYELFFNLACALIDEERRGEHEAKGTCGNAKAYLADHPGASDVLLPLAQLYAQQHRYDCAVEALSQLPVRRRAQPQTVEAIVGLHQRQKSPEKALACARDAINYWATEGTDADEETFASVLRIAARLAEQMKDKEFLSEVFQVHLEKVDGSDTDALCGLVQALAVSDVERAEQYAQRLRVPDYDQFDAEELEASPIPKIGLPPKKREKEEADEKGEVADDAQGQTTKQTRKRHRKPIYPKGFDPEHPGPPPDPERWLPKRERTEYKKRMKKRDKNLARGPQGSVITDDNAFRKQGPSTAQVEVAKDASRPSRNQGRKKQGKK